MSVDGKMPGGLHTNGLGLPVNGTFTMPSGFARPPELAHQQSFDHPLRIIYRAPAASRAIAMWLEHPHLTICGLSALALFGLPFFADSNDTTLRGMTRRKQLATQFTPLVLRRPADTTWAVRACGYVIPISPPEVAVAETLQLIRHGTYSWQVYPVDGYDPTDIRAIQLIDASLRHLSLPLSPILTASRGMVNQRWLKKVSGLSSALADSPKETEMRLLILALCRELGLELGVDLVEQHVLKGGDKIITVFDLAIPGLRIGIMYDGEHHLTRQQRDRDSRINIECALQDWAVIRVTAGTLHSLPDTLRQLVLARRGFLQG